MKSLVSIQRLGERLNNVKLLIKRMNTNLTANSFKMMLFLVVTYIWWKISQTLNIVFDKSFFNSNNIVILIMLIMYSFLAWKMLKLVKSDDDKLDNIKDLTETNLKLQNERLQLEINNSKKDNILQVKLIKK